MTSAAKTTLSAKKKRKNVEARNLSGADNQQGADKRSTTAGGDLLSLLARLTDSRIILIICLFSCLAYANSLGGDFVYDDVEQIVENPAIRSWDNLPKAFTTHVWTFREQTDSLRAPTPPPYYRPIFTVMLTVEYQLFGLWQQGWHLVSLMLHILCSVGVFYVLLKITGRRFIAAASAILFAVYSIHVESVSWISGMTDPLFGVFFLFSFYYYLKHREGSKRSDLVISLGLFAAAALSKETALSLVPLVFVFEFIESATSKSRSAIKESAKLNLLQTLVRSFGRALPFLIIAVLCLVPRFLVLGGLTWKTEFTHDGPFTDTLLTLPSVILTYLWHLAWPVGLSIAYQTSFVTSAASMKFLLPMLGLCLIALALVIYRNRISREAWHALALIFIPLVPVLNLRHLSEQYLVFDRYLYLSAAGWCLLLALGIEKVAAIEKKKANAIESDSPQSKTTAQPRLIFSSVLFVVLVAGLTVATARENRNWADHYALWSNAARVRPGFWAMHYNTGLALMDRKQYAEARESLLRASEIAPDEPFVFDALGRASDKLGDSESAVKYFKRALEINPSAFESLNNLGTVYFNRKDYQSAERSFQAALVARPESTAARYNLGLLYSRQGRNAEAIRELEAVTKAAPTDPEAWLELGLAYEKLGQKSEARASLERALSYAKTDELAARVAENLNRIQ